jgi:hypothetical protein
MSAEPSGRALTVVGFSCKGRVLSERLPVGAVAGERYNPILMSILDG